MSDEIVFYHNPQSRGRIVLWMLEEVGAPYRLSLLDLQKGQQKGADYLALNPMGKVPAIVHRGAVVTEAAAICAYLADAFPDAGLAPRMDEPERGPYYRWLFFAAGCVEAATIDRMFSRPLPDRPGTLGYGSFEDVMRTLETAITPGPYILGERFSAADVYVGSHIGWGLMTKAWEPRPALATYMAKLTARPAFQRSTARNAEIAAQMSGKG